MNLSKDLEIEFVSDHGQKLKGRIIDFNDVAIQVSNDIGTYIIAHNQVVHRTQIDYSKRYEYTDEDVYLGWWD